jgi:hypothetical protein
MYKILSSHNGQHGAAERGARYDQTLKRECVSKAMHATSAALHLTDSKSEGDILQFLKSLPEVRLKYS